MSKIPSKAGLSGKDSAPNFPSFNLDYKQQETFAQKVVRKTSENPFVPIGLGATLMALGMGLMSMLRGDSKRSQVMMRARVGAQGFTVASIFLGVLYKASQQNKEGKSDSEKEEARDEFLEKVNRMQEDKNYQESLSKK